MKIQAPQNKNLHIPFNSLSFGKHKFEFILTKDLFENSEKFMIDDIDGNVKLNIEKTNNISTCEMIINCDILTKCDICVEELKLKIEVEKKYWITNSKKISEDDENFLQINSINGELNIKQEIFDLIILTIPMKKTHVKSDILYKNCQDIYKKFIIAY